MNNIESGWEKLLTVCLKCDDKQQLSDLLKAVLTPEEYENVAKRMLILEALMKKELSQRDMAEKFDVSIAKITRGSNELKRMPAVVKAEFEKIFCE